MIFKRRHVFLFLLLFVAGCAAADKDFSDMPPEGLYKKGFEAFKSKDYVQASEYFDEVERRYPYSVWASRAQIMSAYSFYQKNEYDDAILVLERFIQLHPGNRNTPYAYYLKGLCYYEQISDVTRDQKMTELALLTFEELLVRFPDSVYANDAKHKLTLIENYLAGKEMSVGRYYQKKDELLAAINRFQSVVQTYPDTAQLPEALYRLTACYFSLGLKDKAAAMVQLMTEKFPSSQWTVRARKISNGGE